MRTCLFILAAVSVPCSAQTTGLSAVPGTPGGESANASAQVVLHGTTAGSSGGGSTGPGGVVLLSGYPGQLYDVVSVDPVAAPAELDEESTLQIAAIALMDDETTLALDPVEVGWSVLAGPLTGVDGAGLATAGPVFEDSLATVRGIYQGVAGDLDLTVMNVADDNYPGYAEDGIADGWQALYFGLPPNADAGPGENPDGDPHDNLFEYLTGYSPTDGSDFFSFEVVDVSGGTATLNLSKVVPGTRYRVERSSDLGMIEAWSEIASFTPESTELHFPVNDPASTGGRQFYRVEVLAEPE